MKKIAVSHLIAGWKGGQSIGEVVTSATVKGELEPSKRPSTGGWPVRVSDCPHVIESRVSGECSLGMDDVLVMRSSLESNDGTRRHTDEEGSGCDTAPLDASMSRLRKSDTLPTNLRQEGDVLRLQSISPMQKGGARTTYNGITCFTVCVLVLGGAASRDPGNANGCRISQLQHVGCSSRPTTRKRLLVGATPVSFVFWNHGTDSGQGNSSVVPRSTKEGHCGSSNQETARELL